MEPGAVAGRRRHLCRVEEGGSIFAISGVRGRSGGGLVAVGAGPAELLKFSRGDLIRLSFEEGLTEQVALLIDDWLYRVGLALSRIDRRAAVRRSSGATPRPRSRPGRGSASAAGPPGCATSRARRGSSTRSRCPPARSRPGSP